jgi:hypothetical protein
VNGRAVTLAGVVLLGVVGCNSTVSSKSTPSPRASPSPCKTHSLSPPPAGSALAIMTDVSGGPGEYLVGVPGGKLTRVFDPTYSPPRLALDTLFVAQGPIGGVGDTVTAVGTDSCHIIGPGVLTALNPATGDAIVSDSTRRTLYSRTGKTLRTLPVENQYSFTNDGHLVGAGATGLLLFPPDSGSTKISTTPSQVLGPLGPSSLIVEQFGNTRVIEIPSGKSRELTNHHFYVAAGSPDGKYIAGLDSVTQAPQVLRVSDLRVVPLPQPGPPQSFAWAPDSDQVAVNSPFGGAIYRVSDTKITDIGLLDILSW